jgi:mono/diheme cytochrome c family protein
MEAFEMNTPRTLIGVGLLAAGLLAAATASDGAPSSAAPVVAAQLVGDAHVGKETFTQYCSICHGKAAQGFIGPHIGGITWTVPGLHAIVRNGVGGYGGMPAFSASAVTDQNIADIEAYLASLAPAATANASTTAAPAATVAAVSTVSAAATSASPPASATLAPATAPSAPVASASADLAHGKQIYSTTCSGCHGASGQGGFGPSLRGESARKNTAAAIAWIKNPKAPMPKLYPNPLSEKDVDDVAAYIESL